MLSNFRYKPFVEVSGNLGRNIPVIDDVLSSHEQEIYFTTSLDENCIQFDFQTDGNYYVDLRLTYLAPTQNFVKSRVYEIYNTKEVKKEHKEEAKADEKTKDSISSRYSCRKRFALNFVQWFNSFYDCLFVLSSCHLVQFFWRFSEDPFLRELLTNQLFGCDFCKVQQDSFYCH